MYSNVEVSLHSQSRWCFEILNFFWMFLGLKNRSVFNSYKKKIVWQFYVRSHVTKDLGGTRLF